MSERKRIVKNTGFLYIRMLVVMVVTLFTSRVVLQTLGVVDYGIHNVIGGVVVMLSFLNNCAGAATSRYLTFSLGNEQFYKYSTVFNTAFVIHIGIAILIAILGETVGLWYVHNKMVIPIERMGAALWVYQISIITVFVSFTQVPYNASIIAHEKMDIYAYVGLFEAFAKLGVVYLLCVSPVDKLKTYSTLLFLVTLSLSLFYRWYCVHSFGDKCRLQWIKDRNMFKELLSYSGWDLVGNFAGVARSQGVNLILNLFFGPAVNAARAVAYNAEAALYQFTTNFLQASRPIIIKHYAAGEEKKMLSLLYETAKFAFLLFSCLAIPFAIESDCILVFWLGTPPAYSSVFLKIVLVNYMVISLTNTINIGVHATGDVRRLNVFAGSKVFVELPVIYILLKAGCQPYWALIVLLIGSTLVIWIDLWVLRKNIPNAKILIFMKRVVLVVLILIALPTSLALMAHNFVTNMVARVACVFLLYWFALLPLVYRWGITAELRKKVCCSLKMKLCKKL